MVHDVVIIGSGPSGATCAGLLARSWRVALVDAEAAPRPRIGESLVPAARRILRDTGLLESVEARGYPAYNGNVAAWGGDTPEVTDFICDPDGQGWHVDRVDFENLLRKTALSRGADMIAPARLAGVVRAGQGWHVTLSTGQVLTTRFVIDATGRKAALARHLGQYPWLHGRGVALWMAGQAERPQHGVSTIASTPNGWWYSAWTGTARIVSFHTDSDLAKGVERDMLIERARAHPLIGETLQDTEFSSDLTISPAHGAELAQAGGRGWLAIGDAALAVDPLASRGLFHGLYTALLAASEVDSNLASGRSEFTDYINHVSQIAARYRAHVDLFYRTESRWSEQPYWQRRHAGTSIAA